MNKYFITFCTLLISLNSFAQKNYEYQDTRRNRESFLKLHPANIRAEVATFALGGISESVGTTPLPKISYSTFGNDFMNFQGDTIQAFIKLDPFDKTGHRLDYDEDYLIKIDRKAFYGNYGYLPKTHIKDVTMIIGGDTIAIPKTAYFDLYNLNLTYSNKGVKRTTNAVYKSNDGRRIYLYLFSKDNTGSYEVTWIFQDKNYLRRVLDYGIM